MTADAWEPVDFLAEFRERETCLREVTELLTEKAQCQTGKLWAHHLPRIVDALGFLSRLATGRHRSLRRVALSRISTR
jgi:hypothetical protein